MEITNIADEALRRYFKALSTLGYKSYNDVNKLILILFIEELLTGPMSYYISDDDYNIIMNTLECLYGSTCLLDMPTYDIYDTLIHDIKYDLVSKTSEDNILRNTESGMLRAKYID